MLTHNILDSAKKVDFYNFLMQISQSIVKAWILIPFRFCFLNDLQMKVDESESTIYLKNDYGGGNVFEPSRL